jgi:hypothetical protein
MFCCWLCWLCWLCVLCGGGGGAVLAQQNAHECFDQFRDAVAQADDIEMEGVEADTIREMYSTAVAERKEVEDALIEQLKVLDEPVMTEWIKRADALFYTSDTVEQTKKLLFDTSEGV